MTGIQVLILKLQTAEINFDNAVNARQLDLTNQFLESNWVIAFDKLQHIRTRLAKSNYHKTK